MLAVGVDTGGTFTDAFVSGERGLAAVKVETTPHDLSVCFAEAVRASAEAVGLPLEQFLRRAGVIRFSSTVATNTVLTRSGLRLGLVVSKGDEADLYGAARGGGIFAFLDPSMVEGVDEAVSPEGLVERAPDRAEVTHAVRSLLERGARMLVVSLGNAAASAQNERAVHAIVDESYPRHYLGAVPVLLSTQVSGVADDAARTTAAVVDAYVHRRLATSLYRAEDDVRRAGFRRPLLVVNTDGGVTRVAKTKAIATYHSGPTAGVYGSALLCRLSGIEHALTIDVGGTSTDVGLVISGRPVLRGRVEVGEVEVAQPSVELVSFAVGGGSVASVEAGAVRVGPESAGSAPGPACFGLGGRRPTPTDAWLVLGYLDPDYYLGGRRRLDVELARRAVEEEVARPLGLEVEEAALAIKSAAARAVVESVREMLGRERVRESLSGLSPGDLALVAYGGGGGLLLPEVARGLGAANVVLSRFSPVFSAFGVSTFDVRHRYEARRVLDGGGSVGRLVEELADAARRDMRGEGFDIEAISLAVSVSDERGRPLAEELPPEALAEVNLPRNAPLVFELVAVCAVEKPQLPEEEEGQPARSPARKGSREVVLPEGRRTVEVYAREALRAGNVVEGPAIVEAPDTTYLLPDGVVCRVDRLGSALLAWKD